MSPINESTIDLKLKCFFFLQQFNLCVCTEALRRFDGRQPDAHLPMGMANRANQQAALRAEKDNVPLAEYVRRVGHTLSHTTRRLGTLVRRDVPFAWGNNGEMNYFVL